MGVAMWPTAPSMHLRVGNLPLPCSSQHHHVLLASRRTLPSSLFQGSSCSLSQRAVARAGEGFELAADSPQQPGESGPIELPDDLDPSAMPTLEVSSPLQSAASILLTGTIAVFLYRSLQRRAKLAKETKFRSSGLESVSDAPKKEPLSIPKQQSSGAGAASPPSVIQTLLGAVIAGAIALVLYNFATYVEAGFAAKPVSPVYTIRQLTITIRTIVNGLCYLAAFIFAANSIGLALYSLQLAFNVVPTETPPIGNDKITTDLKPLETSVLEDVKEED